MNRKKRPQHASEEIHAPGYPLSGPGLYQKLRTALSDSFGFQPGFDRLGRIVGEDTGVAHYWFTSHSHGDVIGFLSLFERLPKHSEADIKVTRDLIRAGQLLKIEVLDHVVIGRPNFSSLRASGYCAV